MDNYVNVLLDNASKLDAITNSGSEITKCAMDIANQCSHPATIALLKQISVIINTPNQRSEIKLMAKTVKTNLVEFYGYTTLNAICKASKEEIEDSRTLDDLLSELNALVGLETVKTKVNDLIAYQKVQKLRAEHNLHTVKNTLHLAFTGNPGTGKTTVARIVGHIYKRLGLLSKGHFVEVSRTDLIAGYQGQTALKVKEVIGRALGGVLFIDEAYSITENDHSDSYGRECLTELTKALEDHRDDLVVIVAGYTRPMEDFFNSNPGLKSRFNTFIEFPDYAVSELERILVAMCEKNDYGIEMTALETLRTFFEESISTEGEHFSNGRLARNIYDDLVMNHARRVATFENPTVEELSLILQCDFQHNE